MATKEDQWAEEHARRVFKTLRLPAPDGSFGELLSKTWEVTGLLGRGGEATVLHLIPFPSENATIQPVALKVLNERISGWPRARQRLRREVEHLRSCAGPHVVRVEGLAANEIDEPGLLLELINPDGKTLKERALDNARCVDLARKIRWFEMCVDGVGSLHRVGFAHRDLKSNNFCVSPDGHALKLIDLTMSVPADSNEAGLLCGTEHYWPPDRSEDGDDLLQVDLFALCLVFAEMLLGRVHDVPVVRGIGVPALDRSLRGALEKALWRMHGDLGQLSLPKSLVAFARKGTMPNQVDRYQTIEQLHAALELAAQDL